MFDYEYIKLIITSYYLSELIIVSISLIVFLYGVIRFRSKQIFGGLDGAQLYTLGGYFYAEGGLIRNIRSTFVHSSFSHLYGNMFSIVIYGYILQNISDFTSLYRFIIFMVSSILASFISRIRMNRDIVSSGASGGAMGLRGAVIYILLTNRFDSYMNDTFFIVLMTMTINDLIIQTFSNISKDSKINVYVHIVGFISGFIISMLITQHLLPPI